ncbi:MAG: radical SAM protein [Candidatus Aenigmarchaeota archaeon]|nr:radical SAM protein [Candidatus Aenigmarchaeota archaeon]
MKQGEIYSKYAKGAPCFPPLGLCYIASMLEKNHNIKIIDGVTEKLTLQQLRNAIQKFDPDIVGITSTTVSFLRAVDTAKVVKSVDKDIIVILGGPHVSAIPKETFENYKCFDIGVVGEGEYTMLDLLQAIEKQRKLKTIRGIVFRKNRKIIITQGRESIKNLDELPFPARHLLPNFPDVYNPPHYEKRLPVAHMITSRGCPYRCIFCTQAVFGRTWRGNSPKYMLQEVTHLIEKFKIKDILFQDDLFTFSQLRVMEFCDLLINENIDLTWSCSTRVNLVNKLLLEKMYKAGCRTIYYGIESGDQNILNFMNKGITLKHVIKVINLTKLSGIESYGSFILGFPTETPETIEKTIEFALKLPLDAVSFHITVPYPGTVLSQIANQYGTTCRPDDWSRYRGHPDDLVFIAHGLTDKFLIKKQKEAYRRFYFRFPMILRKLKEIDSLGKVKLYINGFLSLIS